MRKAILTIMLVGVTLFTVGCASSSKSNTIYTPTSNTTAPNTSVCVSTGTDLSDVSQQYIDTVSASEYEIVISESVRLAAISTGEDLSSSLRLWASNCNSVSSDAASSARALADSIDRLVTILRFM